MSSSPTAFSPRGIAPIATIPLLPAAPKAPQPGPAAAVDVKRWLREAFEKQKKDDLEGATVDYRRVLAAQPTNRIAWGNLGVVYRKAKKPDMAVACYMRALEGDEDNAGVLGNLGNAYKDLERFDESLAAHQRAIALDPMSVGLLHNYGVALSEGGMPVEARRVFDRVLEMDPDHVDTHWDRAICSLRLGDFSRQAWDDYEWRWKLQELGDYVAPTKAPVWRGEKLEGRTLLVYSEQGFGDTLFALRYLPRLKGLDGTVILRCQPDLMRLAKGVEGYDALASAKDPAPRHDLALPIMSLLGRYTRSIDDILPPAKLSIPAGAGAKALPRIAASGSKFKIGIVWSGSVTFRGNLRRAVTLDRFLRFAEVPGVQLFSLQKGPPFEEYRWLAPHPLVVDLGSTFEDFADTAAALRQ